MRGNTVYCYILGVLKNVCLPHATGLILKSIIIFLRHGSAWAYPAKKHYYLY